MSLSGIKDEVESIKEAVAAAKTELTGKKVLYVVIGECPARLRAPSGSDTRARSHPEPRWPGVLDRRGGYREDRHRHPGSGRRRGRHTVQRQRH